MVQQTSLNAFIEIGSGLGIKQLKILCLFRKVGIPLSNSSISSMIKWPINCVTPRVKELREIKVNGKPLIKFRGYGVENGRRVMLWGC